MTEDYAANLTVIIVNWNAGSFLAKCVDSVFGTVLSHDVEMILVDNNSTDRSLEEIRQHPRLQVIRNQANHGFARANNQGIALARGQYLLLLNPDTRLLSGAVDQMIDYMDSHPAVGALGPRLLNRDHSLQPSCSHFPTLRNIAMQALGLSRLFPRNRLLARPLMTYWEFDHVRDVDQLSGACLVIRRSALDEVGLLDERFYLYYEEVDLCFRLKKAGWKVRFFSGGQAIHVGGHSSSQNLDVRMAVRYRSLLAFFSKHFPPWHYSVLRLLILLEMLWRAALLPISDRGVARHAGKVESLRYLTKVARLAVGPRVTNSASHVR